MRKVLFATFLIIFASFILGVVFYNQMPDRIITHWDVNGEPNGYSSKAFGLFLIPVISLGILLLFLGIFYMDPLKKNIEKFINYYYGLILVLVIFLFYTEILTIISNMKKGVNILIYLIPALSILFYYLGIVIANTKRNWIVGIRTPWTLSSDYVWDKTHKNCSKLFKLSGIICLIGLFFSRYAIWFIILPLIVSAVISIIYSYLIYSKKKKKSKRKN